jgi:hypothetical protein
MLVGEADGPVRLLLAFATSEGVGVEGGDPTSLPRATRSVEKGEDAVGVVHGGDLGAKRSVQ